MDRITVYEGSDGWRWRKQADNGRIVADSGEAYDDKAGAEVAAVREAKGTDAIIRVDDKKLEGEE